MVRSPAAPGLDCGQLNAESRRGWRGGAAKLEAEKVSAGLDALGRCSAPLTGDHYRTLEAIKQLEASSMIHLKASLIWQKSERRRPEGAGLGPNLCPGVCVCVCVCKTREL